MTLKKNKFISIVILLAIISAVPCIRVYIETMSPAKEHKPEVEVFPIYTSKIDIIKLRKELVYRVNDKLTLNQKEFDCLARNIYFEAGIEPEAGKIAVAQVTHNRLKSSRWGQSYCSVIYAPYQFSWTADSKKRNKSPKGDLWESSKVAAKKFLDGARIKDLENSQHYHANYVSPSWGKEEYKVKEIGQHIFYDLDKKPIDVALN